MQDTQPDCVALLQQQNVEKQIQLDVKPNQIFGQSLLSQRVSVSLGLLLGWRKLISFPCSWNRNLCCEKLPFFWCRAKKCATDTLVGTGNAETNTPCFRGSSVLSLHTKQCYQSLRCQKAERLGFVTAVSSGQPVLSSETILGPIVGGNSARSAVIAVGEKYEFSGPVGNISMFLFLLLGTSGSTSSLLISHDKRRKCVSEKEKHEIFYTLTTAKLRVTLAN